LSAAGGRSGAAVYSAVRQHGHGQLSESVSSKERTHFSPDGWRGDGAGRANSRQAGCQPAIQPTASRRYDGVVCNLGRVDEVFGGVTRRWRVRGAREEIIIDGGWMTQRRAG